jgi:hypothetical protein
MSIERKPEEGIPYSEMEIRSLLPSWELARWVRLAVWLTIGMVLVAFGFAIDGTSEWGHHFGLIVGGVVTGGGIVRSITRP